MPLISRDSTDFPVRAIIESVQPEIDGGRFPAKRVVGEQVVVEADIFAEGHDKLFAVVLFRGPDEKSWREAEMEPEINDRWRGSFTVATLGRYAFTLEAWVDNFKSWQNDLRKRLQAGQNVGVDLQIGANLVQKAAERAEDGDAKRLRHLADEMTRNSGENFADRGQLATGPELTFLMKRNADRSHATRFSRTLEIVVEPVLARYGAWYEFFPRSLGPKPGVHGTLKDCEAHLPRVAKMGFDVLYLPPIHPIGTSFRKGRNNAPEAEPGEPGSPWGIGSEEGGHKSVHPELGTLDDFRQLVTTARDEHQIEIAMDIAFQCSPDHPYVREHPEWFITRPDGTIQYAENPPKKYQDIYPLNFETSDWQSLWTELQSVFTFWIEQGVTVFRVDNPHTKALPFWEWVIEKIKESNPEVIFLAEAFTRPKVMYYLAKCGFSQSYNYFPWRNTKYELEEFMTEVTRSPIRDFFRPNLWPNTPDILPQYLQYGGQAGFTIRLILAATLGASYGIYGPAFELCDHLAREPGAEEYLNSEKYQLKDWNLDSPENLTELIARINQIRRENPALHSNDSLVFHPTDNEQVIAYTKHTPDQQNILLMLVNLDPHHTHTGWLNLQFDEEEVDLAESFQVHDLLTGSHYLWDDNRNYFELNPHFVAGHIFLIRRRVRTEHDFDYFM